MARRKLRMSDNWRSEWSRHYDQIQWIATTVFTAGIAGLLSYSYSQTTVDPWIISIGLWLTIVTVYYAVSFRNLRDNLHNGLLEESEERNFLMENRQRRLKQWPVFFLTFVVLMAAWIRQFFRYDYRLGLVVGLLTLFVVAWLWDKGKDSRRVLRRRSD